MKNNKRPFAATSVISVLLLTPAAVFLEENHFADAQSLSVPAFALADNDRGRISSDLLNLTQNIRRQEERVQVILQLSSEPGARLDHFSRSARF